MAVDVRRNFHQELEVVRLDIVRLAGMVSEALAAATDAFLDGDLAAAERIQRGDDPIDELALHIEEHCYQLLALQQPMASDLREVTTAIRLTAEIERSGDLVVNIMKASRRIYGSQLDPRLRGLIERFGAQVHRLFRLAMDAYVDHDGALAAALDDMDDDIDDLHVEFIQTIFETHESGRLALQLAVQLALVGRFYERIGDHAVNIGERVSYLVTGWLPEHTGAARQAVRKAAQEHGDARTDDRRHRIRRTGRYLMRVLVTNDDGIGAEGIAALAAAIASAGHDLVVAAPLLDMSGTGASLGGVHADMGIDLERVELPAVPGVACYGVAGPPALAVLAACMGGFGARPDVVVSGINRGANTGGLLLHSGTVGAALTAANLGISGLAVSVAWANDVHWETPASLAVSALDWLVAQPSGTVVNLNVPNVRLDELRGVRWAPLAPFGSVEVSLVESRDDRLQLELRQPDAELAAGTDAQLLAEGWATVTALHGPRATEPLDGLAPELERSIFAPSQPTP